MITQRDLGSGPGLHNFKSAPPPHDALHRLDNAACGGLRPGAPAHAALAVFSRSAPPTAAPALSAPPPPSALSLRRRRRRRLAQLVGSLYKGEGGRTGRLELQPVAAAPEGGDWWWFPPWRGVGSGAFAPGP